MNSRSGGWDSLQSIAFRALPAGGGGQVTGYPPPAFETLDPANTGNRFLRGSATGSKLEEVASEVDRLLQLVRGRLCGYTRSATAKSSRQRARAQAELGAAYELQGVQHRRGSWAAIGAVSAWWRTTVFSAAIFCRRPGLTPSCNPPAHTHRCTDDSRKAQHGKTLGPKTLKPCAGSTRCPPMSRRSARSGGASILFVGPPQAPFVMDIGRADGPVSSMGRTKVWRLSRWVDPIPATGLPEESPRSAPVSLVHGRNRSSS